MTTISFTGDVAFSSYFDKGYKEDPIVDDSIREFLLTSDYCVANIEGPVLRLDTKKNRTTFMHSSASKYAYVLNKMNFNIWSIANNHILDYGADGVKQTLQHAAKNNASCIGAGNDIHEASRPYIINNSGGIGIISVSYDQRVRDEYQTFYYKSFDEIEHTITKIKEKNRWCVIIVHAGHEFADMPLPNTRDVYLRYLKYGADVVIGHHPHVVQNYETVGDKIIFYSIGNFIFDTDYQRVQNHTDIGLILKLIFASDEYRWKIMAVKIDRDQQRIVDAPVPIIFSNISTTQYERLWKAAARQYILSDRKALSFVFPKRFHKYNNALWTIREIKQCLDIEKRRLIFGSFQHYFTKYKTEDIPYLEYMGLKK